MELTLCLFRALFFGGGGGCEGGGLIFVGKKNTDSFFQIMV